MHSALGSWCYKRSETVGLPSGLSYVDALYLVLFHFYSKQGKSGEQPAAVLQVAIDQLTEDERKMLFQHDTEEVGISELDFSK